MTIDRYGRGEAMAGGGASNVNADVFLLATPYAEHSPSAQYSGGKFPPGSDPTWENAACLAGQPVIAQTARSVGMYIFVEGTKLTSCSATLVAPDLIVTAGHCLSTDEQAKTGSLTFDFQTDCAGNRPPGYSPKFHKLKRVIRAKYVQFTIDYCIIQFVAPPGGIGLPIVPFRPDLPPQGEPLFIVHHPRGAPKKVSRHPVDPECMALPQPALPNTPAGQVYFRCDIDNGSSGSSIFDTAGRIVANLSQWQWGTSSPAMMQDIAAAPAPPKDVDVVLVFDRSGSMSLAGFGTSETKLQQAKRAAELFVSLLRTTATHRVGLVTFSTTPSPDVGLAAVAAAKGPLIGPPPPGAVGSITAGGNTTIGGGLLTGATLFPPSGPAANTRAMLLLTDGLQNTDPSVETGEAALGPTLLNVIGFGTDASLDGPRLTRLARDHGGIYWRAEEGLSLKKYFALAFGNIFDYGTSLDPRAFLPAEVMSAAPVEVRVCGESELTAIIGWDNPGATLLLGLETPGGSAVTAATPGVAAAAGGTWAHLRVALPFAGERDGVWKVRVTRPGGGGEFPPPRPATHYFAMAQVDGGPVFYPLPLPHLYTGDVVNPLVALSPPHGAHLHADVTVEIESPLVGTGNLLRESGLGAAGSIDGDPLDARTSKLIELEQAGTAPLIPTARRVFPLFDDGAHDDGAMEPDGVFGNPLPGLTTMEGTYTFHAVATYGHDCTARRETTWSAYVSVGIDPDGTTVTSEPGSTLPDGRERICLRLVPRDRYGNHLGPGRAASLELAGQPGSTPDGPLTDHGDGSYTQCVLWDPGSGHPPGVSVGQPGRPPVVVRDPTLRFHRYVARFVCGTQAEEACRCTPLRPGTYATDINIYNPGDREVRILKRVVPVIAAGAVVGREPRAAHPRARAWIVLPPHSATMDDCCRLGEMLFGAAPAAGGPLTTGSLEIVSTGEIVVTAVYTVTSPSGAVEVDTEQVRPRRD